MKRINFCRKTILRAIKAACFALFLMACSSRAEAQTFSSPFFQVSGTTYNTHPGIYTTGGFNGPTAVYTVTIDSATTLNSTSASYGSANQFYNAGTNIAVGGGTFSNGGTASLTLLAAHGFYSTVALYGSTGGDITATNSGSLTATLSGGAAAAGVSYDNSDFNDGGLAVSAKSLTLNNNGMISGTASGYGFGIHALSAGTGNLSITNQQGATIQGTSSGNYAEGIYAHAPGSGVVTISNSGTVSAYGLGGAVAVDAVSESGAISITNNATGHVTITDLVSTTYDVGMSANTSSGPISITNNGSVSISTASAYAIGLTTASASNDTSDIQVSNGGSITINSTASGGYGIAADNEGTGNATVTNAAGGAINATASGYYVTGISAIAAMGTAMVTNDGTISVTDTDTATATGIEANGASVQVSNTGSVSVSGSGYDGAFGIQAGGNNVMVNNTGSISVSGSGYNGAFGIQARGNNVMVNNMGSISVTGSGYYGTTGIDATSKSGTVTVANSQSITASGSYKNIAIHAFGSQGTTVTNSGTLSAYSSGDQTYGISASAYTGPLAVTNTGTISTNGFGFATGITAFAILSGDADITNNGNITASSTNSSAIGLQAFSEHTTVNNTGSISAMGNSGSGTTYGIEAESQVEPAEVTNSGYVSAANNSGSSYGIYLLSSGTVNNSGTASGGTYSIFVPTHSTVNLTGNSPIHGLLKGGVDDTSDSLLNFAITVRTNYAASKAALDAAIADYATRYAAANGDGNNVDSVPVLLNGIDYQWEDFGAVEDNLVQARLYALTSGYQGIGGAIDNFDPASVRGTAILAALDNLPDSAVAGALAQLSPQSLQVLRHIAFDGASFTAANVNNHLANLRDGLTGFDTSGFTVNSPGIDPTITQMRSRLLAFNPAPFDPGLLSDSSSSLFGGIDMKDTQALVNTQPVDRWSAFISGNVVLANLDNTSSTIGDADYTTGSVMAGVDYRLTDHVTVGALFNYAHTSANLDGNGSKATVDSYSPGIYASYVDKKGWYGNAMLMYGFNNNTDDRNITIPGIQGVNHGASGGGQVTSNMTGGYEFQRGHFKFGPVASLQYVHLTVGSFQEQGPTSLSIDRQEADSLRTQLGFEVRYSAESRTPFGLMTFTPHFQASWQHEYMDNSDGISSQFNGGAGGGSFIVQGQQPERDSAFLDLGLDAQVAKNVTLFVDYQTQAGQNDFFAQSAQGGVKIGF